MRVLTLEELRSYKGNDIHRWAASKIFGVPEEQVNPTQRSIAKIWNMAAFYGTSGPIKEEKIGKTPVKVQQNEHITHRLP